MSPEGLFISAPEQTNFTVKGCLVEPDVFLVDVRNNPPLLVNMPTV